MSTVSEGDAAIFSKNEPVEQARGLVSVKKICRTFNKLAMEWDRNDDPATLDAMRELSNLPRIQNIPKNFLSDDAYYAYLDQVESDAKTANIDQYSFNAITNAARQVVGDFEDRKLNAQAKTLLDPNNNQLGDKGDMLRIMKQCPPIFNGS